MLRTAFWRKIMNETEPTLFNKDFLESARECASYIFDSGNEQTSYQHHIQEGNDPTEHIMYHAAIILGKDDQFNNDIQVYEEFQNEWTSNT